jgi:hypothetical protein
MPLARIITRIKEDADELATDLRGRGFEIEIVSPDDIPAHSVDLEVRLEECGTEDALTSAENVAQPQDICVFIAPGAIVESARPMVTVPLLSDSLPERDVPAQPLHVEKVTIDQDEPQLEELVASRAVAEDSQPTTTIQSPVAGEPQSEFGEDSPVTVLEGEAVIHPPTEAEPAAAPAAVSNDKKPPRRLRIRITQSDKVFWRVATAMATLAVGGLLTLSAHRPPMSPALEQSVPSVQQAAPFAGAKVSEVSLPLDNTALKPPAIVAAAGKPTAVRQVVAQPSPAPARKRAVAFHTRRHSSRSPESDLVAEDTVIRYGKPPAALPVQQKKPAIKHHSDLK